MRAIKKIKQTDLRLLKSNRSNSHFGVERRGYLLNSKCSNSRLDFENEKYLLKSNRSQAEVIVTVLLILIAIAAIAIVATFVMKLVKDNLKGTDCFKTVGQFEITSGEDGISCYCSLDTNKTLFLTIKRGAEQFNMSGFSVQIGGKAEGRPFSILALNKSSPEVKMYNSEAMIFIPGPNGKNSYVFLLTDSGISDLSKITLVPVIQNEKLCDGGTVEKVIAPCSLC